MSRLRLGPLPDNLPLAQGLGRRRDLVDIRRFQGKHGARPPPSPAVRNGCDKDSLTITWDADLATAAEQAAAACKLGDDATHWTWSSEAEEALKFAELLPPQLRRRIFVARIMDSEALAVMSAEPVRVVAGLPIEIEDL